MFCLPANPRINRPQTGEYPISIVATTGMVGDIVRKVPGDLGEVTVLIEAEVDPHLYRLTRELSEDLFRSAPAKRSDSARFDESRAKNAIRGLSRQRAPVNMERSSRL